MSSDEPTIKVRILRPGARLPAYHSDGAAGLDLAARLDAPLTILPRARELVPTGLAVEIPAGWEGQVRPRSGLALKHGVTVLNAPGTIDSDYRCEIGVLLVNLGEVAFTVSDGERVAQLVIAKVARARVEEAALLSESERGAGGYGHTGR